jgi:hypothetical protein
MIKATGNEDNKIHYECDCGTKGYCLIKPQEEDAAIVVDIKCPNCAQIERMVLLQYSSDENKEKLLEKLDEVDLSWTSVLETEILDDEDSEEE